MLNLLTAVTDDLFSSIYVFFPSLEKNFTKIRKTLQQLVRTLQTYLQDANNCLMHLKRVQCTHYIRCTKKYNAVKLSYNNETMNAM